MRRIDFPNNASCHFIEDKFDTIDEIRKMVGLSVRELKLFFMVLSKCSYAHVNFEKGNMNITMISHRNSWSPDLRTIEITTEVNKCKTSTSIKHEISEADLALYLNRDIGGKQNEKI
jgi:hypothetical protein